MCFKVKFYQWNMKILATIVLLLDLTNGQNVKTTNFIPEMTTLSKVTTLPLILNTVTQTQQKNNENNDCSVVNDFEMKTVQCLKDVYREKWILQIFKYNSMFLDLLKQITCSQYKTALQCVHEIWTACKTDETTAIVQDYLSRDTPLHYNKLCDINQNGHHSNESTQQQQQNGHYSNESTQQQQHNGHYSNESTQQQQHNGHYSNESTQQQQHNGHYSNESTQQQQHNGHYSNESTQQQQQKGHYRNESQQQQQLMLENNRTDHQAFELSQQQEQDQHTLKQQDNIIDNSLTVNQQSKGDNFFKSLKVQISEKLTYKWETEYTIPVKDFIEKTDIYFNTDIDNLMKQKQTDSKIVQAFYDKQTHPGDFVVSDNSNKKKVSESLKYIQTKTSKDEDNMKFKSTLQYSLKKHQV